RSPNTSSARSKPITGPAMMPPASRNRMPGIRTRHASHWQAREVTPIPARIRAVLAAIRGPGLINLEIGPAGNPVQQSGRGKETETGGNRAGCPKTSGAVEPDRAVSGGFLVADLAIRCRVG